MNLELYPFALLFQLLRRFTKLTMVTWFMHGDREKGAAAKGHFKFMNVSITPECRLHLHGSTLFRETPNETKIVHAERRYKVMGFLFEASVLDICISVQPRKPFLEI
jgi:hypothetical protein